MAIIKARASLIIKVLLVVILIAYFLPFASFNFGYGITGSYSGFHGIWIFSWILTLIALAATFIKQFVPDLPFAGYSKLATIGLTALATLITFIKSCIGISEFGINIGGRLNGFGFWVAFLLGIAVVALGVMTLKDAD